MAHSFTDNKGDKHPRQTTNFIVPQQNATFQFEPPSQSIADASLSQNTANTFPSQLMGNTDPAQLRTKAYPSQSQGVGDHLEGDDSLFPQDFDLSDFLRLGDCKLTSDLGPDPNPVRLPSADTPPQTEAMDCLLQGANAIEIEEPPKDVAIPVSISTVYHTLFRPIKARLQDVTMNALPAAKALLRRREFHQAFIDQNNAPGTPLSDHAAKQVAVSGAIVAVVEECIEGLTKLRSQANEFLSALRDGEGFDENKRRIHAQQLQKQFQELHNMYWEGQLAFTECYAALMAVTDKKWLEKKFQLSI